MAAAIGIDLGSAKAVMGVTKRKGIDIVLNEGSNRSTPVCIAYQMQERLIGDSVKTQIKRNFLNSVMFPMRFLGLNAQCNAQIDLEKRFTTHKVVPLANNKIGFELVQQGNSHVFTVEQVIAFYLRKLREFYVKADVTSKDVVITIPSYASNTERQSLVDACEIAGLKCLRVINESTAICYNYGFFRKGDLSAEDDRIVAFIDMGNSKTTVTIAAFKQKEARMICHKSDRNLGGRDLDYAMMQKIGEEFMTKHGDDPRENVRCKLRMLETCEKARKMLSSDTESGISIDYLLNDEDLNRKMNREEFEQLIDGPMRQFTDLLREALKASGLVHQEIHNVELVGDCTRTPIVQAIIKQVFEKTELNRTLNSIECIARGAALNSAMMTPFFNVSEFKMDDYNHLPINVNYQFQDLETGESKDPKEYRNFFALGQKFPLVQQLKFDNKEGALTLKVDYSDEAQLMTGLPASIACYTIGRGSRKHADTEGATTKLAIRVKNNINQIPELERVEMTECWTEEEKIPVKVAAPAKPAATPKKEGEEAKATEGTPKKEEPAAPLEQKYEIKQRKKERTSEVPFKTISHAIPPDMKIQFRELEDQLMSEDRKILDLKEAKYVLESFCYEMKNGVDEYGNLEHFIDPSIKAAFQASLAATTEWIYAEGENAPLEDQRSRLIDLQSIGQPMKNRLRFRNEFEDYVTIFNKYKTKANNFMEATPHLTDGNRQLINDKVQVVETFYLELRSTLESLPRHEEPTTTLAGLERKQMALESEINGILAIPAPVPEKEEEKKAEEPADAAEGEMPPLDDEMKDEQPKQEAETEAPAQ